MSFIYNFHRLQPISEIKTSFIIHRFAELDSKRADQKRKQLNKNRKQNHIFNENWCCCFNTSEYLLRTIVI